MSGPKFMKDKTWRSAWPEDIVEVVENSALPDVSWKGQIAKYRRVFQAMMGVEGVNSSLSEISDLTRRMERWSDRHDVYFSWPPTMEGWSRAVWATLGEPQGKDDMAWLIAGYGPSLRLALSERPSPTSWSVSLQAALAPAIIVKDSLPVAPAPQSNPPTASHVAVTDASPRAPRRRSIDAASAKSHFEESKEVLETRAWISLLLKEFINSDAPQGLLIEKFDREIKDRVEARAQSGQKREAGWLEYEFIPAIAALSAEKLETLVDLWSVSHSKSFIDPQKTLSGKRFWAILEGIEPPARGIFVNQVLPKLIDSSEWSSSTRYKLATEMLAWTKARPEAFEERLSLWQSWGGRLDDAEAAPASDGNRFSKVTTTPETVEAWIKGNNVPAWNQVMERAPRSRATPGIN
jgi:hypothetical protein